MRCSTNIYISLSEKLDIEGGIRMSAIDKVKKYSLCSGCGLCSYYLSGGKIELKYNNLGNFEPYVRTPLSSEENKQFLQICPQINMVGYDELMSNCSYSRLVGKNISYYHGWAIDSKIRQKASSGGVITALAIYALDEKLVDGIIQVRAKKDRQYETEVVVSENKEEVESCMGSRYTCSSPLDWRNLELTKSSYLFIGRPCDIRALYNLKKIDTKFDDRIKYTIAFFCGGSPSIKGTFRILKKHNISPNAVGMIEYRGNGWPGCFKAEDIKTKSLIEMSYNEAWSNYLGPTSPMGCKICFDGIGEFADISCGDAWSCDDRGYPLFEEQEGRNVIIIRSSLGQELLEGAIRKKCVFANLAHEEEFNNMQPSQTKRRKQALCKIKGIRLLGCRYPQVSKKFLEHISDEMSFNQQVKIIKGTCIRSLKIAFKRMKEK